MGTLKQKSRFVSTSQLYEMFPEYLFNLYHANGCHGSHLNAPQVSPQRKLPLASQVIVLCTVTLLFEHTVSIVGENTTAYVNATIDR